MIGIGIVTFNPDLVEFLENLKILLELKCKIVIIDNNSMNIDKLFFNISNYENILIIKNKKNLGIAKALNQIFEVFSKEKTSWVLTFDQDTRAPKNIIKEYRKYLDIKDIGIISPLIRYQAGNKKCIVKHNYEYIDNCITSGSMVAVDLWKKVNGFDEKFFIDFVDFDFCYRARFNNYKIIRVNTVCIQHELGNLTYKRIFGIDIYIMNHNSLRKYYYVRNAIFCYIKNKKNYKLKSMLKDIILIYIKTVIFEEKRIGKIIMMCKGIRDGIIFSIKQVYEKK